MSSNHAYSTEQSIDWVKEFLKGILALSYIILSEGQSALGSSLP